MLGLDSSDLLFFVGLAVAIFALCSLKASEGQLIGEKKARERESRAVWEVVLRLDFPQQSQRVAYEVLQCGKGLASLPEEASYSKLKSVALALGEAASHLDDMSALLHAEKEINALANLPYPGPISDIESLKAIFIRVSEWHKIKASGNVQART
jgi:hypothetical protein